MTRPASVFNSVQWLNAAPLMDSTSKPAGMTKLNLKIPARVMATSAVVASTVRSSPSDSVSCVSTRTSGSTAEAFRENVFGTGRLEPEPLPPNPPPPSKVTGAE